MSEWNIRQASKDEITTAFDLLKKAAMRLQEKGIQQWSYWLDPPAEKREWVKTGFDNHEFYFIEVDSKLAGMFRLMETDELYWGKQVEKARYIHSLVIVTEFSGKQIGKKVIDFIMEQMKKQEVFFLRLDCDASNLVLCSYYEKQGFIKVGEKQMPLSLNNLYERKLIE